MLREAKLILPKADNAGRDLSALAESVAAQLTDAFGGCRIAESTGLWRNPATGKLFREPCIEEISACEPSAQSNAVIRRLAAQINRDGRQSATYAKFADGHVEIIEANKPLLVHAA